MTTISKIDAMHKRFGVDRKHKCGECINLIVREYGNRYFKCSVYGMSSAVSTDWRKKWTACGMFNKEVKPDNRRALTINEPDNQPMDGQITIEV